MTDEECCAWYHSLPGRLQKLAAKFGSTDDGGPFCDHCGGSGCLTRHDDSGPCPACDGDGFDVSPAGQARKRISIVRAVEAERDEDDYESDDGISTVNSRFSDDGAATIDNC